MDDLYKIRISAIWQQLKKEQAVFWLFCFYIFIEYVRPQSTHPQLDTLPWAKLAIILTFVTSFLKQKINIDRSSPMSKLMFIYFIVIIISWQNAIYPDIAYNTLSDFYIWWLVYYIGVKAVTTRQRFFIFYLSFLLYSFKMSQHGFLSWAAIGFSFRSWGVVGSPGWFANSGEFGIQLCIFVPMSLYFIFALREHWGKIQKTFFYAMPVTGFACIIATTSRGALVGAVAAFGVMVAKSKYLFKAIIGVSVVSVIGLFLIPDEFMARFDGAGTDDTSVHRLNRWKEGLEMLHEYPSFGIGFNNWLQYCIDNDLECANGLSHNIFIQVGSELGYAGLIVFVLMIAYCLILTSRTRKLAKKQDDKFGYLIPIGLDAALVGYLVSGFFVTVMYYPYFWIHIIFVVSLHNIVRHESIYESSNNDKHSDNSGTVSKEPNTLKKRYLDYMGKK
jgi:putative inorganic carbon (hco3(-)) transporter